MNFLEFQLILGRPSSVRGFPTQMKNLLCDVLTHEVIVREACGSRFALAWGMPILRENSLNFASNRSVETELPRRARKFQLPIQALHISRHGGVSLDR